MGQVSYKDFRTRIRKRLWVSPGEPRNLVAAHDEMFKQAMIDLGKWVECLQVNNTSVFPACSSYVECAKTIVESPAGAIKRVYAIANDEWCDRVFYWKSEFRELECKARNLITTWTPPENIGLPALQQGIKFAEKGTDSSVGRARIGVWATYRRRFYLFPWLQSNESLVIEWDGYKTDWNDADILDETYWTPDVEAAIASFVKWQHELYYGSPDQRDAFRAQYQGDGANPGGQRGDLMYWSKKLIEQRDSIEPCAETRLPTSAELTDDAIPETTPDSQFAIIGDFGNPTNGTAESDVAVLVKGWDDGKGKFFIVTSGDNIYAPTNKYSVAVTPFYGDYITQDLTTNRFWPALGNHDYTDPIGGVQAYYDFFKLPNNERYYDFVKGATHFFILNSSLASLGSTPPDPDGLTATSKQALWLKAKLALSTAKWKIVVVQDPPYTLGTDYPGHSILRWPYQAWGADIVISGDTHAYERYDVAGFPYIVCGTGGAVLLNSLNADAGHLLTAYTQITDDGRYGALKCSATCTELLIQFMGLGNVLIDELKLTKA